MINYENLILALLNERTFYVHLALLTTFAHVLLECSLLFKYCRRSKFIRHDGEIL